MIMVMTRLNLKPKDYMTALEVNQTLANHAPQVSHPSARRSFERIRQQLAAALGLCAQGYKLRAAISYMELSRHPSLLDLPKMAAANPLSTTTTSLGLIKFSHEQPLCDDKVAELEDTIKQAGLEIHETRCYTEQQPPAIVHVVAVIANYDDMSFEEWSVLTEKLFDSYGWYSGLGLIGYKMSMTDPRC